MNKLNLPLGVKLFSAALITVTLFSISLIFVLTQNNQICFGKQCIQNNSSIALSGSGNLNQISTQTSAPTPTPTPEPIQSNYPLGEFKGSCHNNNMNKDSNVTINFRGNPENLVGDFSFDEKNLYGSGSLAGSFNANSNVLQFHLDSSGEPYTMEFSGKWSPESNNQDLIYIVTNRDNTQNSTGHCYGLNQVE